MSQKPHQPADRGQATRDAVLDAAERLMSRKGYSGTGMAELIKESGVPSSSIYWHFSSKAGVLAAVMERGETAFLEAVVAAQADDSVTEPRERLRAVIAGSVRAVLDHPSFLRLYLAFTMGVEGEASVREQVRHVRARGIAGLRGNLADAYRAWGEERAGRVAGRLLPLALAFFDGTFISAQAGEVDDPGPLIVDAVDALHAVALSME